MKIGYVVGFGMAIGIALAASAQQRGGTQAQGASGTHRNALQMTIPAFADGSTLPTKFSCVAKGHGASPEVHWSGVPAGTQSFVILMHDPEAHHDKGLEDVTHWLIWNIPGTARGLPEGVPAGDTLPDGTHQVPAHGSPVGVYFGPCAPPGSNHHYVWNLYALDTKLNLPAAATREEVMKATDGHILGSAVWIGLFHR